ncbi:MAG: bifunctional glutamate N-acetyltransferase/amino-acid acetyltransferase ArgJ [Actinomycetota bacterium]|nr:bifunctional glutamate N-acetyltransferase/amino-acid acetyltransferase ArgJ [Actinomycetota bacterium]
MNTLDNDDAIDYSLTWTEGGVVAPGGFLASGVAAGIKRSGRRDVCVVAALESVPTAAVYTQSSMAAPPVTLTRKHLADGLARAVVVNAGNANACTGAAGHANALAMAETAATQLGCEPHDIAVSSTGVIGVSMPMQAVLSGIREATAALDSATGDDAAEAIMTTDTFLKQTAVRVEVDGRSFTVGGMAKGSGMIMPNMATMLAFLTCDAPLSSAACDAALRAAVDASFNRITVDSDTSTNDMCMLMASGAKGGKGIEPADAAFDAVAAAVAHVCTELARMIVRDGEGATKFIEVTVRGAESDADAPDAARSIANSPLFKTAIFGADANWGRVAMAVGKSSAKVDQDTLEVIFAGITTCRNGMAVEFDEIEATEALAADEIEVIADLHLGQGAASVWTCDLSYEYVRINGEYRT